MNYSILSKNEQQEITEVLAQLGLNNKEQEVYTLLLSQGKATITPLAKALNFPSSTIQSILARLEGRGFLNLTKIKSKSVYEANDPVVLKAILERQIRDVGNILPILKKLKSDDSFGSKVKVFYRERMTEIFHEALGSKNKLVYEIVSADDFQKIIGEKFHFTRRRIEKNIFLKSLRVEEHEIKKYNKTIHEKELREAKFLPRELTFRASLMFWDNKIAIFTTKGEGVAMLIESAVMFEMMKQIFDLLWSVSRRMETV
jgi:sugar-specific transcriptional regulator TrmB